MNLMTKKIMMNLLMLLILGVFLGCQSLSTETTSNTTQTTTEHSTATTTPTQTVSNPSTTTTTKEDESMLKEDEHSLAFDNGRIAFVISKANGSLSSLINKATERDFISNSAGGNFSVLVDTSTADAFASNPRGNSTYLISSRNLSPTINTKETAQDIEIQMIYDLNENSELELADITIRSSIFVSKNGQELTFEYEINNDNEHSVVINLTGPILSGIKDEDRGLDLFWPNKEGKIYDDVIPKAQTTLKLSEQYPSPFSMQIAQLFDEEESLYYYVEDNTREYKEFKFGAFTGIKEHDQGTVKIADKISLSCTQFPFVESSENKMLFRTKVGISSKGDWYEGADLYRDYLINSGMTRTYNDMTENWTGFVSDMIARWGDRIEKTYTGVNASDQVVKDVDHTGIDTVVLFGWHQGGFDYKYPDYELFEGEGFGFDNFKAMVDRAHANGDKVLPYLNAHIIAMNSEWGNSLIAPESNVTNMLQSAIKKAGFSDSISVSNYPSYLYYETYGTDTGYYAACPFDDHFVQQIQSVVDTLADAGADGLWMDQMMEMPAYLCYDKNHGHKTPATAYGEGYRKLYGAIDEAFQSRSIDYLIFAEGVTDAWIEYIDIPGYMWARQLYAPDNVHPGDNQPMAPHITVYTMPASFLGINSYQTAYNHAHAFLFGSPLASGLSTMDISVTSLYTSNPDIYMKGRYMHTCGLQISDQRILGSIITGSENSLGVQLYNNGTEEITFVIQLSLEDLGIEEDITQVIELFSEIEMSVNSNQIIVTLAPAEMAALRVSYGD